MLFTSQHFLWFFVLVWGLYWCLGRSRKAQNALLLVASWFFYAYWDWRFLGLLLWSTTIDYSCGLALGRRTISPRGRRLVLLVSVVTNLGLLGYFKYFEFFVESAARALESLGLGAPVWALEIVLPVGISFYTFQTLSYVVDCYRGDVEPERDFIDFAFFVAFFPQLVAGPIVRAPVFLPQAARPRPFRFEDQGLGIRLIVWGFFKKTVVADNLAPFVDGVFAGGEAPGIAVRLLAVYAFAVQIYCDFSGYTDIARGTARMLGFEFPWNFRMPYFAKDPKEFWSRWHITLSTWLRDYLYVPLGGNRRGPVRTYVNLMATMVLGGLWHGAAWHFVVWGAYQGLLLVVHRAWSATRPDRGQRGAARLVQTLLFFQLVCLGWLFFRAQAFEQIAGFLGPQTGGPFDGLVLSDVIASGLVLGGLGTLVVFAWDLATWFQGDVETPIDSQRAWVQALLCVALYLCVSFGGRFLGNEFIYFQF